MHTVEEMAVGGLGLHLIRAFASEVQYRRDANRNVLVLTFAAGQNPEVIGRPAPETARASQ